MEGVFNMVNISGSSGEQNIFPLLPAAFFKKSFTRIQAVPADTYLQHREFLFQTLHQPFRAFLLTVLLIHFPLFILNKLCQDAHLNLFVKNDLRFQYIIVVLRIFFLGSFLLSTEQAVCC